MQRQWASCATLEHLRGRFAKKSMRKRPGCGMRIGVVATERRTLELIQIFRGAAALVVMLYHLSMTNHFYSPYLANAFGWGHAGIDFFFQLSGFIMLYVHWDQAGQVRRAWRFVMLRAIRIYPIYWCVLAVTIVMFWLHPPPPENMWAPVTTLQPRTIVSSVLLRDPNHTIIAPAWTLTYEVMFYLFFALYFVVGRWVFALLSLAWLGAIVAQWQGIAYWPHPVLLRLIVGEFFLGMAAAVIVKCWAPRRVSGWWVVLALTVWLVFARAEMTRAIEPYTWWAIPGFRCCSPAGSTTRPRRGRTIAPWCSSARPRTSSTSSTTA